MKARQFIGVGALLTGFALVEVGALQPVLAAGHVRPPVQYQKERPKQINDHWRANDWAALSTGGLFVIAVIALLYAGRQVNAARRQTEVGVLFEIESRWNSQDIKEGRAALAKLVRQAESIVDEYSSGDKEEKKKRKNIGQELSKLIFNAMENDLDTYRKINSLLDLFETIGVFIYVLKGLKFDTVAHLLAAHIELLDHLTRQFMEECKTKDPGAFYHALNLFNDTRDWLEQDRELTRKKAGG